MSEDLENSIYHLSKPKPIGIKKVYYRWTFPCWIDKDLEQTTGNSYRTRSELLDNLNSDWRSYPKEDRATCNCDKAHKPIRIKIEIS